MFDVTERRRLKSSLAMAFAAALPLSGAAALAAGPFSPLSGYWTGGGTISLTNGSSERIRCRATYAVNESGTGLNQSLRCASDSYRLEITGNVLFNGGAVTGTWGEATRRANGNISGRASNSDIQARIDGAGFSAGLMMRFQGAKQSISIRPTSGTDVAEVKITLSKG